MVPAKFYLLILSFLDFHSPNVLWLAPSKPKPVPCHTPLAGHSLTQSFSSSVLWLLASPKPVLCQKPKFKHSIAVLVTPAYFDQVILWLLYTLCTRRLRPLYCAVIGAIRTSSMSHVPARWFSTVTLAVCTTYPPKSPEYIFYLNLWFLCFEPISEIGICFSSTNAM